MTRCFAVWATVLIALAVTGVAAGSPYFLLPLTIIPIIYADQYLAKHYPEPTHWEEEQ